MLLFRSLVARLSHVRPFHSFKPFHHPVIVLNDEQMARAFSVTFLGTSSGGGPSPTRNCSSLVASVCNNGSLWMVDCAEGTLRQFHNQRVTYEHALHLKVTRVNKIFITHMHADHVMGIITFLRNVLYPVPLPTAQSQHHPKPDPTVEIYGPAGIRNFVRLNMKMTLSRSNDKYVVHELLTPEDTVTPCTTEDLHSSEAPGRDIVSEGGFWPEITTGPGFYGDICVDAGPIAHRDPCLGFILRESVSPYRKIVILGDTYDATSLVPLINRFTSSPTSSPPKRSKETVASTAFARGHSTPDLAGAFARTIDAQKLVLNHIGSRFPAASGAGFRASVIKEIERQANEAWGKGTARAAWDYMRVVIPAPEIEEEEQAFVSGSRVPWNHHGDGQHTDGLYPRRSQNYNPRKRYARS
ncbi:beta-lactamase-like protein [Desarmillaria tabescens]|uniref:Beta-lactamase-like protein n=1 Tax=Armillaria tabescens TaxID=1929756 RepID=A0AA39KE46_ARMTA|nr:beta-lactamase-like protein [Desarmillaria tabescens]KAK0459487.1 beta-lactamase-like protein [Desarmillaria tabescens]